MRGVQICGRMSAAKRLVDADHVVEVAVAGLEQHGLDAERAERGEVGDHLVAGALQGPAVGAERRVAERQAGAHADRDLVEGAMLAGALIAQPRDVGLERVRGDEGGVPAVAELHDAAERARRVPADQDRDVATGGLGEDADPVEGEEFPVMLGAGVAPAGAHDRERLVAPGAAPVEVAAQQLDLLAHPAHAHPEHQPAPGEVVDGGGHLGREDRVPVREHQDAGAEPHALGDARHEGQRGQRLEEGHLGRERELAGGAVRIGRRHPVREHHVIARPEGVVAEGLHAPREA